MLLIPVMKKVGGGLIDGTYLDPIFPEIDDSD